MQQQQPVVVVQPGYQQPASNPGQPAHHLREWTTGLCGCCEECGSCLYAWCCFPCFMCTLSSRMDECTCGPFFFDRTFTIALRTKLRTMHGIKGSILGDCCVMTWCNFCGAHQMYRELDNIARR